MNGVVCGPDCPANQTRDASGQCVASPKNLGATAACSPGNPHVGNPLHAGTGNKYQAEDDYRGRDPGGLRLTRHYNSQATSAGPFGQNWSAFPSIKAISANSARVVRPDQRELGFTLSGSAWLADADITDRLERLSDADGATTGWRYRVAADDSVERYDATGKLLSITDRAGWVQALVYDGSGRLTTVTDAFGRALSFSYDAQNRISGMTDPAGGLYQYTYDAAGNLASVTTPDGGSKTYHYEDSRYPHALTGITDQTGQRFATYAYDDQGRAISSEHAGGAGRVDLVFNADGSTRVTDALGTARTYGFQTILGVVKGSGISQPGGAGCNAASSAVTHDANGNAATRDDFNGHRTRHWHDPARNLETTRVEGLAVVNGAEQVRPETRTRTTAWHASFRLPALEKRYSGGADSSGVPAGTLLKTTAYTYDANGNLTTLSETDNVRNETRSRTWTYASLGRVLSTDGPRSDVADVTTYAYYPDNDPDPGRRGQLWKVTNALGHVTEVLAYDLHGHPTQMRDANGLVTTLAHDARGRLMSRSVGTRTTAYAYDAAGNLVGLTLPDASHYAYTYDAAQRLTGIQDAQGNRIAYTLDALGNVTAEAVIDAQGNPARQLTWQYDALGRLWQEIRRVNGQAAVTEHAYDAQGNPVSRVDPLGHGSTQAYDALDRLAQTQDALGGTTHTAYDALDGVTAVTDPKGLATAYETDAFGQVRKETSPDRGVTTYAYDAAGNLKTRTDARGVALAYRHDALNRLIRIDRPGGIDTRFTWDQGAHGRGRLTGMADESGTTGWTYTPHGEVAGKTQTHVDGLARSVGYTVVNGVVARIDYPSGAYAEYAWSQGRVSGIRVNGVPVLANIAYAPFAEATAWTWGNGPAYRVGREAENAWVSSYPLGADSRTLAYDAAGHITAYGHSRPGLNQRFDYDALDRLVGFGNAQGSTAWDYDANGNCIGQVAGANAYSYAVAPDSNRLLSVAGPLAKAYQYDAAGNVLHDGTYAFIYNDFGRLERVLWGDKVTRYRYNGLGQRVQKAGRGAANGPLRFVYDEAGRLLGEYDGSGQAIQETVWLGERPVAVITPAGILQVHADHLNAPRVLTDASGAVVWRWNSDPFGVGNASPDPDKDGARVVYNLRLPGQYFDRETGLHYNTFRDYDPRTGRYVQADPIGLEGV